MTLPWLDPDNIGFPPLESALADPNGLLAVGGALSPAWLLTAYSHGIFPWYEEGQPILWWAPDPRLVIYPEHFHASKSLKKLVKKNPYVLTMDRDFPAVMTACAAPRENSQGTWITPDMLAAYKTLHGQGHAHSVEVWDGDKLVGGLYGIAIGQVFFGESMFSRRDNTSKLAMYYLVRQLQAWNYALIDCQVDSPHLRRLGATEIPRHEFARKIHQYTALAPEPGTWHFDEDLDLTDDAF